MVVLASQAEGRDVPARGFLRAALVTARPRQWVKNGLVLAAPAAAGVLLEPGVLGPALGAVALFCLAASGTYFLNDALDAEADRLHPRKRRRPIAAGQLSVPGAFVLAAALLLGSSLLGVMLYPPAFAGLLAGYAALTIAYSLRLKHEVLVDIVTVAAGFLVRAAAGGAAVGVVLSQWFLLVTAFGALFLAAGKRHAEVLQLGDEGARHRAVLPGYTPAFTQHVLVLTSTATLLTYCLWAFEVGAERAPGPWSALSILPFFMIILRYAMLVHQGEAGEPEEILLKDGTVQLLALLWAGCLLALLTGSQ